jgi:hypothetical protein
VLVDFERLEILKQVEVLQETSLNRKRKHLHLPGLMEVPLKESLQDISRSRCFYRSNPHVLK